MTLGWLIFPNIVVLHLPNPVGQQSAGNYDETFRTPKIQATADGVGEVIREEKTEVRVPAQLATGTFDRLALLEHGRIGETTDLEATFHFRDLQRLGLVRADGRAKILVGVRMSKIEDKKGNVLFVFDEPDGMWVTAARPSGFLGPSRNLWVVTFSPRRQGADEPRPRQV